MDVLRFVTGRAIEISDAFRIGSFNSSKSRPVVVKLTNVWDRRLLLQ